MSRVRGSSTTQRRVTILLLLLTPLTVVAFQEEVREGRITRVKPDEPMMLVFPTFLHTWGMQKAGETHMRLFLGGRTRFDDPQGVAVTVLDAWDDPEKEGDDDEITTYGVNSGRGEIIYNTSMFGLDIYGEKGRGAGQFLQPHGIDADPAGNVVVADTGNDRVAVLFNDGRLLSHRRFLASWGPGMSLSEPIDVALTPDEGVWVSDSRNGRVVEFGLDGTHRRTLDLSAAMQRVGAIALAHPERRWTYPHLRRPVLFVADGSGDLIVRLDEEGIETARMTATDLGRREMKVQYMTVDFYSNLWVTDSAGGVIHKFDMNLKYLGTFDDGEGKNRFDRPRGLDIWPRFGQMVVAETRAAQYFWVGADARDLTVRQSGDQLTLNLVLEEYTYLTLRIRYEGGGLEEVFRRRFLRPGPRQMSLRLQQQRPVAWAELVVEPTYSSYTYREKLFDIRFSGGGR